MIVTVTLNPTLDKTLSVHCAAAGGGSPRAFCARTSAVRGSTSLVRWCRGWRASRSASWAAPRGRRCVTGWSAEGYDARFVEVPGETRQNLTLLDAASGVYTKINEPGPTVNARAFGGVVRAGGRVGCPRRPWPWRPRGSLSRCAGRTSMPTWVTAVQARGARAILDTSEHRVAPGAGGGAAGIKPNSGGSGPGFGTTGAAATRNTLRPCVDWSISWPRQHLLRPAVC